MVKTVKSSFHAASSFTVNTATMPFTGGENAPLDSLGGCAHMDHGAPGPIRCSVYLHGV